MQILFLFHNIFFIAFYLFILFPFPSLSTLGLLLVFKQLLAYYNQLILVEILCYP